MITMGGCRISIQALNLCFAFRKMVILTEYSYSQISFNKPAQRTGARRVAQRQIQRHRRLAPVAHLTSEVIRQGVFKIFFHAF